MASVMEVAKAAFQEILVRESEGDLEPDEYEDFIFALNNYMSDLEAEGIDLGYTIVDNVADTVTVPAGAVRGIVSNMAIEMAPQFQAAITIELIEKAKAGMKTMRKLGQTLPESAYPFTLPTGSGNYDSTWDDDHFFPDREDEIQA